MMALHNVDCCGMCGRANRIERKGEQGHRLHVLVELSVYISGGRGCGFPFCPYLDDGRLIPES